MTGSEFARRYASAPRAERERAAVELAKQGKHVAWPLLPIDLPRGRIFVSTDYFAIGTLDDYVRMPLGGDLAQEVADALGLLLPTKLMVDLVWRGATQRLSPQPWGPPYDASMYSMTRIVEHNARIEEQRGAPSGVLAGHKKDVVLTNLLEGRADRVAIYGWHRADGTPIQGPRPNATAHELTYSDYSHGIRFVSPTMVLDGESCSVLDVLRDPKRCALLSDEGALRVLRYPTSHGGEPEMQQRTIRRGDRGDDVKRWQAIIGVTADGIFGPGTEAATKAWQTKFGLTADGIVGPKSWAAAQALAKTDPPPASILPSVLPFVQARNYRPGRRGRIDLLVVHTMEAVEKPGTAEAVAAWFAGPHAPMASAHYCVDSDSVVQCVKDGDTAFHAKGANHNGIGIEHAGYAGQGAAEWADPYSVAMLDLSAQLAARLCARHDIPLVRLSADDVRDGKRGFCGHIDVTRAYAVRGGHHDPGPDFPWDRYIEMIRERANG
jgi:hypothetical protein